MTGINPYTPDAATPADPGVHPLAGDTRDDDGTAIDEAFESGNWGVQQYDGRNYEYEELDVVTRLITSRVVVGNSGINGGDPYNPVILLPSDKTRQNVQIFATANSVVFIANTRTLVMTRATAFQLPTNGSPLTLDSHTGPVVVWSPDAGEVVVQAVAVCK